MPPSVSVFEFQVRADRFLANFTEEVKRASVPLTMPIQAPGSGTFYVDRIEWGESLLRQTVPETYSILTYGGRFGGYQLEQVSGRRLQILQRASVFAVSEADLLKTGNAQAAQQQRIDVTLVFRAYAYASSTGGGVTCIDLEGVEDVPSALQPFITPFFGTLRSMASRCRPIDIPAFAGAGPMFFSNAGMIAASPALDRVVTRLVINDAPATVGGWQVFFNGQIDNDLQGQEWSLSMQKAIAEQMVYRTITEAIADNNSKPNRPAEFYMQGGVDGSWVDRADGTQYRAHTIIDAIDACGPMDVRTDLYATVDLTAIPDRLQATVELDARPNSWDQTKCGLLATLLWPVLGYVLQVTGKITPAHYLTRLLYLPRVFWDVMAMFRSPTLDPNRLASLGECQSTSSTILRCTQQNDGLRLVRGLPEHVVLAGARAIRVGRPATITIDIKPFTYFIEREVATCFIGEDEENAIRADPAKYLRAYASISLFNGAGDIPLYLYSVRVLDDGASVNKVFSTSPATPSDTYFEINFRGSEQDRRDYFQNPYACVVLIQTSAGSRIITLPALVLPNSTEMDAIIQRARRAAARACEWFVNRKRIPLDLQWLEDPIGPYSRHWEVTVSGVNPGDVFELKDRQSRVLDRVRTDHDGKATIQALAAVDSLSLTFVPGLSDIGAPSVQESTRGREVLEIRRTALEKVASLDLPEGFVDATLGVSGGKPSIQFRTATAQWTYDASTPRAPVLADFAASDRPSAVYQRKAIVPPCGCGAANAHPDVDTTGVDPYAADRNRESESWAGYRYALEADCLVICHERTSEKAVLPAPGCRHVTVVSGVLVLADVYSLTCYTLSDPRQPAKASVIGLGHIERLSALGANRPRTLLAIEPSGRSHLVDVSRPEEPEILSVYPSLPWFGYHHRFGHLVLRAEPGDALADVYIVVRADFQVVESEAEYVVR